MCPSYKASFATQDEGAPDVDTVYLAVYKHFMEAIDGIDNGVQPCMDSCNCMHPQSIHDRLASLEIRQQCAALRGRLHGQLPNSRVWAPGVTILISWLTHPFAQPCMDTCMDGCPVTERRERLSLSASLHSRAPSLCAAGACCVCARTCLHSMTPRSHRLQHPQNHACL